MPISQQIGASSLIKPGVVDSAALRPASPYEGQVIFQKDTDQMLVWNGTAWVIPNAPAQNPMGLELVTTATCSSGGTATGGIVTVGAAVSSIVIDNAFNALYTNYKIIYSGGVGSTSAGIHLRVGGISTDYSHMLFWQTPGVGGVNSDSSSSTTQANYLGGCTTTSTHLVCDILSPFLSARTGFVGGSYLASDFGTCIARHNLATSYTSVTVIAGLGTLTGGQIRIYGYRNS